MSKERELLREIMCYIASGVVSITSNDLGDAAETLHEIQELLAQPEQEQEQEEYFTDTDRKILKKAMVALCKVVIDLKSKNTWNESLYATVEDVVGVISKWAMDKSPSKL